MTFSIPEVGLEVICFSSAKAAWFANNVTISARLIDKYFMRVFSSYVI
jgi:hypothetical protein